MTKWPNNRSRVKRTKCHFSSYLTNYSKMCKRILKGFRRFILLDLRRKIDCVSLFKWLFLSKCQKCSLLAGLYDIIWFWWWTLYNSMNILKFEVWTITQVICLLFSSKKKRTSFVYNINKSFGLYMCTYVSRITTTHLCLRDCL